MLRRGNQRGDTLIEVLFAITVFSLVTVATLSLMNQGVSTSRRSLESMLVREQIDGQAESLRFLHESYVADYQSGATYNPDPATTPGEEYSKIISRVEATNRKTATQFNGLNSCPATVPAGGFFVNPRTARLVTNGANMLPTTAGYAQLEFPASGNSPVTSRGIWIEGIRTDEENPASASLTKNAGYIDFHIRACWSAPGLDRPLSMGTIVRLYEPRG